MQTEFKNQDGNMFNVRLAWRIVNRSISSAMTCPLLSDLSKRTEYYRACGVRLARTYANVESFEKNLNLTFLNCVPYSRREQSSKAYIRYNAISSTLLPIKVKISQSCKETRYANYAFWPISCTASKYEPKFVVVHK